MVQINAFNSWGIIVAKASSLYSITKEQYYPIIHIVMGPNQLEEHMQKRQLKVTHQNIMSCPLFLPGHIRQRLLDINHIRKFVKRIWYPSYS